MKTSNLLIATVFGLTMGCQQEEQLNNCVAAGCLVLTPTGWIPIELLTIGDEVISVCEQSGRRESSPIIGIEKAMREVGSVSINGRTLLMTSDHPVYDPIAAAYAPAGDWFSGKRTTLAFYDNEALKQQEVESKEMFVKLSEVFDLSVQSELHNFIAEGVLVHNKSLAVPDCEKDGIRYPQGQRCQSSDCQNARIFCDYSIDHVVIGPLECVCPAIDSGETGDTESLDLNNSDVGDVAIEDTMDDGR